MSGTPAYKYRHCDRRIAARRICVSDRARSTCREASSRARLALAGLRFTCVGLGQVSGIDMPRSASASRLAPPKTMQNLEPSLGPNWRGLAAIERKELR